MHLSSVAYRPELAVRRRFLAALLLIIGAACGGGGERSGDSSRQGSGGAIDLTGAGATFPQPLYSKWVQAYSAKTGVRINYQALGSGAGIKQLSAETVDFGASDGPMNDKELASAQGGPVIHIPTTLGAVVVTYNLPGLAQPLRMTPDVVAGIFQRTITRWNDPRIATANPGVTLPARDILVTHRSDGSGTTFVFTDYLAAVSPEWSTGPGRGKAVKWPKGTLGGKGNEGVAALVKQAPGAVGYVELAYALQNEMPVALLANASGNFVAPSIASITAAAAGIADTLSANTDFRISIVNAPGAEAYPISSFTWILLYQQQEDPVKGRKLVDFLAWAVTEGQQFSANLHYAPLPEKIVAGVQRKLSTVTMGSE